RGSGIGFEVGVLCGRQGLTARLVALLFSFCRGNAFLLKRWLEELFDNRGKRCDEVLVDPPCSCAAGRGYTRDSRTQERSVAMRFARVFCRAVSSLLESLILAQDERWRRA